MYEFIFYSRYNFPWINDQPVFTVYVYSVVSNVILSLSKFIIKLKYFIDFFIAKTSYFTVLNVFLHLFMFILNGTSIHVVLNKVGIYLQIY